MTIITGIQGNENKERLIEERLITIAPGESYKLSLLSAEFVFIKDISPVNNIEISLNDMQRLPFRIGDWYRKKIEGTGYLEKAEFFNTTEENLTINVLFGAGDYENQSTILTGNVEVETPDGKSINTNTKIFELLSVAEHTLTGTSVTLDPNGATFTRVQNSGTNTVRLYSATGFLLLPNSTEELTLDSPFTVHGVAGDKVVFGRFA